MKNSKFLLALALPAVLAACSNEEIATKAPNADTEVVGANLVSEGLTINVNKNGIVDSRLDVNGWSASDKLGLGWVNAASNIYSDQANGTKITDTKVYANHMFQINENGLFTTFGNVYEGWHFAYYAYQYMPQVGQMEIVVNPEQKDAYSTEHGSNTFYISAQDYIKAANVDVNTKELKDKVFEVVPAVNELAYRIIPSEQFTNDDVLKSLNIKSIALTTSTDKTPFYSTVTLAPRLLPTVVYDKNGAYDAEETLEKMTVENLYNKKAIVRGEGAKTLTTEVTGEEYDLSGTQTLRMFNTPVQDGDLTTTADASKYSVKVTVSAGYFTVKYTKNAEEGSIQESNNNALEEIAGLLSKEGYGDDEINFAELLILPQGVTLKLDASMFTADYSKITCKEDWEDCVALADALGEEGTVKFNVTGEVKFDEGEIPMPSCDVLVSTSSKGALVIENEVTWPADLTKNEDKNLVITVAEDGILNVNSEVDATSFVNNGLINAGPLASICTEENQVFVNNNRVIVEYGAYVYPAEGNEGVIAFEVKDATQATIGKINVLIKEKDLVEYANVNTLIVSTNLSLNALASSIGASSDRYTGSSNASSVELSSLENITVELADGATLSSTGDVNESVGNIIVKGQSEIVDIKTINGNLTVEEDAELTVSSSYESALDKTVLDVVEDVVNQGTLNADTYIVCSNIDNKIGTTNVAEGYAIVYNDRYYQGGTANGTIAKPDAWLIEAVEAGEEFKMICDVTLSSQLVVNGDVTMNLNDKTIKNTASLWDEDGSWSLISVQSGSLTIKGNGNFTAKKNDCYAVDVRNGATLNIAGGTYNGNISAVYVLEGTANISGGTFKIQQLSENNDSRFTLNCLDANYKNKTAKIVVTGGTYANFDPSNNMAEGENTNFVKSGYKSTASGTDYKVTKK